MTGPLQRIRYMEGSLRCFAWGAISLAPLLGLPAAMIAMQEFGRTRRQIRGDWNPARWYLWLGYVLAWVGIVFTAALCGLAGVVVVRNLADML